MEAGAPPEIPVGEPEDKDATKLLDRLAAPRAEEENKQAGGWGWGGWVSSMVSEVTKVTEDLLEESGKALDSLTKESLSAFEGISEKAIGVVGDIEKLVGLDILPHGGDDERAGFDVFYLSKGGRELSSAIKELARKSNATLVSMNLNTLKFDAAKKIASASRGHEAQQGEEEDADGQEKKVPPVDDAANAQTVELLKEHMVKVAAARAKLVNDLKALAADSSVATPEKDARVAELIVASKQEMQGLFMEGLFQLIKCAISLVEKETDQIVGSSVSVFFIFMRY